MEAVLSWRPCSLQLTLLSRGGPGVIRHSNAVYTNAMPINSRATEGAPAGHVSRFLPGYVSYWWQIGGACLRVGEMPSCETGLSKTFSTGSPRGLVRGSPLPISSSGLAFAPQMNATYVAIHNFAFFSLTCTRMPPFRVLYILMNTRYREIPVGTRRLLLLLPASCLAIIVILFPSRHLEGYWHAKPRLPIVYCMRRLTMDFNLAAGRVTGLINALLKYAAAYFNRPECVCTQFSALPCIIDTVCTCYNP